MPCIEALPEACRGPVNGHFGTRVELPDDATCLDTDEQGAARNEIDLIRSCHS